MRLIQFMSLADDSGCQIQVDDAGAISLVAEHAPPGPVSSIAMVALPLTPRDAKHLVMWLNMAANAAEGESLARS